MFYKQMATGCLRKQTYEARDVAGATWSMFRVIQKTILVDTLSGVQIQARATIQGVHQNHFHVCRNHLLVLLAMMVAVLYSVHLLILPPFFDYILEVLLRFFFSTNSFEIILLCLSLLLFTI